MVKVKKQKEISDFLNKFSFAFIPLLVLKIKLNTTNNKNPTK